MTPRRVFIVEDHPIVLESLVELFEFEDGFETVGTAVSGEEALDAFADTGAELLVTDISLPGMSGLEMTRELCRRDPTTRVLVVSGHQDRIYADQAREAGACGFVTKTAIVTDLIPALERIAAGEQVFA
jgi:two-component system invasion response regulator UvrY